MLQKHCFFTIFYLNDLRIVYNRGTRERGELGLSEMTAESILTENKDESISTFGYELIREILLQEILGDDSPEILYWAGKRLAHKYPLETLEEVIEFFHQASWGNLTIIKESKNEMDLELFSPFIKERIEQNKNCHFQLEAGFIAQQIENQKGVICETFEHPKKKKGKVIFTAKWDKKDLVNL